MKTGVVAVVLLALEGARAFVQPPLPCARANHNGRRLPLVMARADGDRLERRSVVLTGAGAMVSALVVGSTALLGKPNSAAAKYTNIDEAREAGEKKRDELEEQKGPLTILPGGVRYREELVGKGAGFDKGDVVKIRYEVQKGNGDFMFAKGYGREFQQDVGETYDFVFGGPNTIPKAAEAAMEGMKVGGKRKILVPPSLGWSTSGGMPAPETFSGKRKLLNHQNENLIFEVELIRVRNKSQTAAPSSS